MLIFIKLILFVSFLFGNNIFVTQGEVIPLDLSSAEIRSCPASVDSCIYVCDDGMINPCHSENIFTISIDSLEGNESSDGSRYRIFFPWEYNGKNANKFVVVASWPCLRPSAVYASGNYAYWDVFGNEECPGTVQGSIWYGDNCQDENGNIGSDDCEELVGRFCFAPGDTLNWDSNADQSIYNDICESCWMSEPAWSYYDSSMYSSVNLSPQHCQVYDHCHHSAHEEILCGIGYLDGSDSSTVSISNNMIINDYNLKNYPNPFNSETQIKYDLPDQATVTINIYDILGRNIFALVNGLQSAGNHSIGWDGKDDYGNNVPGGLYFLIFQSGNIKTSLKFVLLK